MDAQPTDLDTALLLLSDRLHSTVLVLNIILELRRNAGRLIPMLADELHRVRTAIDEVLVLCEGTDATTS